MTKAWDQYESTIKALYQHHTLASVKQIMLEQYGFKASTRAYRQRLDKWGVTKYKTKKRQEHEQVQGHIDNASADGSNSGPSSPVVSSQGSLETSWRATAPPVLLGGPAYGEEHSWPHGGDQNYPINTSHHLGAVTGNHDSEQTSTLASPQLYSSYDNNMSWSNQISQHGGYAPQMGHSMSEAHDGSTYVTAPHHITPYEHSVYPGLNYNAEVNPQVYSNPISSYSHHIANWDDGNDPDDEAP